jgi:hypothetical protein
MLSDEQRTALDHAIKVLQFSGWTDEATTLHALLAASSPECGEAGWQALRDVIRCLRETGSYHDEEGESTYALEDLLIGHMGILDWAVSRWKAEVANRPLVNVHRRTLDETWRQVIRHCGGDDEALLGPRHSDLVASAAPPAQPVQTAAARDVLEKLSANVRRMKQDVNRGDTVFRCGFNGAIDSALGLILAEIERLDRGDKK